MHRGYTGRLLFADLGSERIWEEAVADVVYERVLSGMGLAAHILYQRIPAGADPLGPENILGFVSGLLTGTGSLFTGRWMVVGKSPLTGGWGDANCGGNLSPAIKRCGYDGIFISGVSRRPVYLYVNSYGAELRSAADLWGRDTVETERMLIARLGAQHAAAAPKIRVACIGPAGEKRSLISGIANDGGRMAARSGLGAVMGAKRLKAIALCGWKRILPYDRKAVLALSRRCNRHVRFQPPFVSGPQTARLGAFIRKLPWQMAQDGMLFKIMLKKWGTVSMNQASVEMGDAPIKNWSGSNIDFGPDKSRAVNPDVFTACEIRKYHCYSCPLGCGGICTLKGPYATTHKPEYETVLALGGLLLNEDPDSIFHLNELLNRAGMDSISAGSTVAFAIECYERGLLGPEQTGGLELTWGNTEAIVELLRRMIRREGIGDLLADGSRQAARRLGPESTAYAMHAGGQDLPMHDGRNDPGFALHYSVEPAPGKHTVGSQLYYEMYRLWEKVEGLPRPRRFYSKKRKYLTDENKAVMAAANSKFTAVMNGAGACLFAAFMGVRRFPIFEWLNAATGWELTPAACMQIGERIQTLRQAFNIKHGVDPRAFTIGGRALGRPPQSRGANRGREVDLDPLIEAYRRQFDWDAQTGAPSSECLARLDFEN